MSDASREFSLEGRSSRAKKQKCRVLMQNQWLNLYIQVQFPRGLFTAGWYLQKPETRQAEAVPPGDRLKRKAVVGMSTEIREDDL